MLESVADRSTPSASLRGAKYSSSRRWLGFFGSTDLQQYTVAESQEQKNKWREYHLRIRFRTSLLFRFARTRLVFEIWPKSDALNRIRIRISLNATMHLFLKKKKRPPVQIHAAFGCKFNFEFEDASSNPGKRSFFFSVWLFFLPFIFIKKWK